MRWIHRLTMQVRMLLRRGAQGTRLDDELRFHLEQQIAENLAGGMKAGDARAAALRRFGNPALVRDEARATWSWASLESVFRDFRYAVRTLRRSPGFAAIAILVMALGIGANVALFTVVRSVLLEPLPFKEPDRLLMIYEHAPIGDDPYNEVAGGIYAAWKARNRSFSSLALLQEGKASLSGVEGQLPETMDDAEISWNLLGTLGVQPALGRGFTAADDIPAASATVLLSWSLWKRRFGGDPAIVNKTVQIGDTPRLVVGVMPEWFAFPASTTQVWMPVYHNKPANIMTEPDNHMFRVVGRLKPGGTEAQAVAELTTISRQIHDSQLDDPFIGKAATGRPLLEHMVGEVREPLYVLLAATGCVLLIACLNVANLLVARAAARRRELAIRTALGGGWLRLMRERLIESLLLSAAGGALGLLLASGAIEWLVKTRSDISRVDAIHIDGVVTAFTIGIIVLCGLFSGLISAFSAGDKRVLGALREASRSVSGGNASAMLRKVLLTLEVGLTVVLLIGAGLLVKSYEKLRSTDTGCITKNVLTMGMGLSNSRYKTHADRVNFFDALLTRVRALPGVEAAGFVQAVPGQGNWEDSSFEIVEHPPLPAGQGQSALNRTADPNYFAAMGIPILRGHTFNDSLRLDRANEILISEAFVRQYFPFEEPLGKHIHTNGKDFVVVGIAGDTRASIDEPPKPMKYFPLWGGEQNYGTLVIRASRNVEQLALPVQRVIRALDRDMAVSDVLTMDQLLGKLTLDQSFDATLLAGFAALSLLLAGVGLFGVLSYLVSQRTTEIGIRIALGAKRAEVLRLMLLDGLRPALVGLALGLAGSAIVVRQIQAMLYETEPLDPAVFASVAGMLLFVAAVACMAPAWRASRLDPMQALRAE